MSADRVEVEVEATTVPEADRVPAMFVHELIDHDRMNAWLTSLPALPDECCGGPEFYHVAEGLGAWNRLEPAQDGGGWIVHQRGWDQFGDDMSGLYEFALCEGCMSAYALPDDLEWS